VGVPIAKSIKLIMTDKEALKQKIIDCLNTVFDPELPVSIYELGLIYEIKISDDAVVQIVMTLTAPSCPAAQSLPLEVDEKVRQVEGVKDVHVMITWSPKWEKSMMSEAAQLELGFM
jgi:FeS assembly SUF system protein